jgi:hypothetical protein
MILEALWAYAQKARLVPNEYMAQTAGLTVDLNKQGAFRSVTANRFSVDAPTPVPAKRPGTTPKPYLLDHVGYVLGLGTDPNKLARRKTQQRAYKAYVTDLAETVKSLRPVAKFLSGPVPKEIKQLKCADHIKVAFTVNGKSIYKDSGLRAHYRSLRKETSPTETCRITGKPCTPGFFPLFKNLPGSKGSNLITFEEKAWQFDGRDSSRCYPLLREIREGVAAAWNHLTEPAEKAFWNRRSAFVLERSKGTEKDDKSKPLAIWWTLADVDLSPLQRVVEGPVSGKPYREFMDQAFLDLSALEVEGDLFVLVAQSYDSCPGRISVLDWLVVPLRKVASNLRQFRTETGNATLRRLCRSSPSYLVSQALLRAALVGEDYPPGVIRELTRLNNQRWPDTNGLAPGPLLTGVTAKLIGKGNHMNNGKDLEEERDNPFHTTDPNFWGGCLVALGNHLLAANGVGGNLDAQLDSISTQPGKYFPKFDGKVRRAITRLRKAPVEEKPEIHTAISHYDSSYVKFVQDSSKGIVPLRLSGTESLAFRRGYVLQQRSLRVNKAKTAEKPEKLSGT